MNGLTKSQQEIVKTRFKDVIGSQGIIRKCMPVEQVDPATRSVVLETATVDDTILEKSDMEVFEVPILTDKKTAPIFDLNCKITRASRLIDGPQFGKLSALLAQVVSKSENYYGVTALKDGGTLNSGTTVWDASITLKELVAETQVEIDKIRDVTQAAIKMIVPSAKKVYLTAPINDQGFNPKQFLPEISEIFTSTAITDKAILVPVDSTVCSLAEAKKLKVTKEIFEETRAKIIATEAIGPVVDNAKAVRVMSI
ncbi:hypothetical protein [Methanococcus maripaludis]|uniref:Uncharacterized protein n=1 Tax=Methanococcus maripaludis TaxID=39152 RepID=A0A8T4H2W1_METMI|nr:hypothetical protein [Methanococcus maripaludis]MBM7408779.1 hypothetical protein [Methanococcus maripaludis]MBP2219052.1 hypothetical protein [Methanococcus maripaludis]